MKWNAVVRQFDKLTAEERWRLMIGAEARGDELELERLGRSSERITMSMRDVAPFHAAFNYVAMLAFIDTADAAAAYLEQFGQDDFMDDDHALEALYDSDENVDVAATSETDATIGRVRPTGRRRFDTLLGFGFIFGVKIGGWRRFCEGLGASPFEAWALLPGFERIQRARQLAEESGLAFLPEGMLAWLNNPREKDRPKSTSASMISVESTADLFQRIFRWCVAEESGQTGSQSLLSEVPKIN